jgi:hypothetical protein
MSIKSPEPAFRITASTVRDRFAEISLDLAALQHRANLAEAANRRARQWLATLTVCLVPLAIGWGGSLWLVARSVRGETAGLIAAAGEASAKYQMETVLTRHIWAGEIHAGRILVEGSTGSLVEIGSDKDGGTMVAMSEPRPAGQKDGNGPRRVVLGAEHDSAGLCVFSRDARGVEPLKIGGAFVLATPAGPMVAVTSGETKWVVALAAQAPDEAPGVSIEHDGLIKWRTPVMAGR